MAPKTITIIGSLNTDLVTVTPRVPTGGETLTATSFTTGPGGKGANQAVAAVRLSRNNPHPSPSSQPSDVTIKMLGAVGADEFGPPLIKGLHADGIDTTGIRVIPDQTTGVAVILVEEAIGENRILLNPGANHTLLPEDFLTPETLGSPVVPDLIILQLEIPLPTVLQIIETAKKAGVDVLINPAPAVPLPSVVFEGLAHLIVNESEAAILTGRRVEDVEVKDFDWDVVTDEFLAKGVRNVVVTLGAKGAFFATQGGEKGTFVKAEKVEKVVDTTAAGDTFVGAYAVGVVRKSGSEKGKVVESDVKLACRAAGRTVERKGAQSAIPWADEVDRR
jgi:ribokinase